MENNNKLRNLASLKAEFHDRGKAARGLKTIKSYVAISDERGLDHLLRHHSQEPLGTRELVQRFEIDALIEFYNLLLIAALVGYVPAELDVDLRNEIQETLDQDAVWRYYAERYPYKMTELTLDYVKKHVYFKNKEASPDISLFYEFISLNRMLKRDADIANFIDRYDPVFYNKKASKQLLEMLLSSKKLQEAFTAKRTKSKSQETLLGFVKYTGFLTRLKALFELTEDARLRSAMWLFHGYYLDCMNMEMRENFEQAFSSLGKALDDESFFSELAEEILGDTLDINSGKNVLKQYAHSNLQKAKADVDYILDPHWKTPLLEYFFSKS